MEFSVYFTIKIDFALRAALPIMKLLSSKQNTLMLKIGMETSKYPWNERLFVLWIVFEGVTVPPVTQKSRLNLDNRTTLVYPIDY
jgi:hypothetical protein